MADYISTGAAPISIRSQSLPAQQSIRIDAGQRVEVPNGAYLNGGVPPNAPVSAEDPALNRSRSEFQQLIFKTRGKDIEHFGLNLFGAPPSTYAITERIAPPASYIIAPGDEIRVRAWGQVDMDFVSAVEKSGVLYIPLVGAVPVAGVSFQDLKGILRNRIGRQYKNFELEVTLGSVHMLQVYVTGRAAKPGSYTIGGLSSLINAVFAVGGPAENGSLRRIALRRGDVLVTELDLYDFILRGDKSRDVRLQSGDVIYFPPVTGYAAIAGSVQNQAIYEITSRSTLKELIDLAGGLSTTAGAGRVIVERIENRQSRVVAEFNTDPAQGSRPVQDGDVVQINPISPRFENTVTVRGHVPETQRLPYARGMRVTDVLPNQLSLLANQYWQVRNEKGRGFHWLLDRPAIGARVAANQPPANIPSAPSMPGRQGGVGTERTATTASPMTAREVEDRLRVASPDPLAPAARTRTYNADSFSGDEPIYRTPGGAAATPRPDLLDEMERGNQDVYWEYATIERFDPATLRTVLIPFHLGKAIVQRDATENKLLEAGDVITVFSQRDIRVPVELQAQYVRIEGEVSRPGVYQVQFGQTMANLIAQAGGLTGNAFAYGTEFTREETRQLQQQELDSLVDRLGESLERSASTRLRESLDGGGGGAPDASAALLDAQRRLVRKMRLVRASGRILLDPQAVGEPGQLQPDTFDVVLQDGDRVYIPARPSTVIVLGAVNRPNAMIYRPGRSVQDYVTLAGGSTKDASKEVLVARANGSVKHLNAGASSWFGGGNTTVLPGDTILLPEETDAFTARRVLRDWTQIIYQGSLGVAGLRLLSDVFRK